jgi:DNA repair exonuclease SbcCD ATPase subunit
MDTGLLLALIGLGVAGMAAVLGIWMERDPNRPPRWAIGLTILIGAATVVSLFQSVADAAASAKTEEDLARMLQTLDKIAAESGAEIPELSNYISKEMEAQTRANPDVIKKMTDRVSAEGGDPNAVLARHLPASEIKGLAGAKGKGAPAPGGNPEEVKKLKSEVAGLKQKLAEAKASGEGGEAAKKAAEEAKKEKAEAEAKVEQLQKELERLQKQNERLKGKTSGGSRWDKG